MDPLSITASIIAVLQATNAVISICYDYSSSVKQSNWQLPKVIEEVKGLRNVLETLELLCKTAESADPGPGSRLPILKLLCSSDAGRGLLVDCLRELNLLKERLSPPSWAGPDGSRRRALVQAVGWPLKEGDTKKALDRIGRYKATLTLAVTADQATLMLAIHTTTQALQGTASSMHNDLTDLSQSFSSLKKDDHREKVHRWLAAPDPSVNHNEACKRRQETSGSWFIESNEFKDWKIEPGSMLWLHGIPGCGKTILSSTIIENVLEHCRSHPSMATIYFYFDFSDSGKQAHESMIRSLLIQLSLRFMTLPQALESLFETCMSGMQQPTVDALMKTLYLLVQEFDQTFIILDALDECKDRRDLLQTIGKIHGWQPQGIHTLLTSRQEMDIEHSLGPFISQENKICLQSGFVDEDIRTYIRDRLKTDQGLKRWQNYVEVQKEIEMTLMSKAGGMYKQRFRWVACQLDELWRCLNLPMLRRALESLPKTLDDTYARILNEIDDINSGYAMTILQWLVYSARPLLIEELAEVVAVDLQSRPRFDIDRRFPEPRDVAAICGSLVTIVEELIPVGDSGMNSYMDYDPSDEFEQLEHMVPGSPDNGESKILVRLAHLSVREYLTSERILAGPGLAPRYSIREIPANLSIAMTCLAYLLYLDMPDLTYPSSKAFPLAGYAARYWIRHAGVSCDRQNPNAAELLEMEAELLLRKPDASCNWGRLYMWSFWTNGIEMEVVGSEKAFPLYIASRSGRIEAVKLLIEAGADVNACSDYYGSPLQAASRGGHYEIAEMLVIAGADVNAEKTALGNALVCASRKGHNEIVLLLLDAGAHPSAPSGFTCPLWSATYGGDWQTMYLLIDYGANVNWCDADGNSLLRLAKRCKKSENARVLEENGAIDYGNEYSDIEAD